MNRRYVKGSKWALSSVATCAAALSFLIVSNTSFADTNDDQNAQSDAPTAQVQEQPNTDEQNTEEQQAVEPDTIQNSAVQAPETTAPVTTSNSEVPSGGVVRDDYPNADKNPLGVAAYFHIFSNDATLNAHTNGNLAVQNLDGNVNFGTNVHEELVDKEISYIQNITNIANSSFVSQGPTRTNKVIFGENININTDNPNRVNVNGTDIDHLTSGETYQDKNGQQYIDFAKEFQNLRDKSTDFSNAPTVNNQITNADFPDQNNRVIDLNDYVVNENNEIILNLSPDVLNSNTPLTIKGLSSNEVGPTVIINVDTNGASNYDVNSPIKIIYDDGSDRNSQETEYFGDNHLLWNFTDKSASDKLNNGTINMNGVFQGSVLAPNSTINVNQNLDGNIIADKVNVNAETHRWDLQDSSKDEEGETGYETPDASLPSVEFPEEVDEEEEEKPEPEEPGTTDPEEPGTTDPEEPGTTEPEEPGTTDPEEPGTTEPEEPGTTEPEEPGTTEPEEPGTTDPEEPGTTDPEEPTVTEPETPDTEEPGTTNPEEPIEGENPGGPEIPAVPDVDDAEEDSNEIIDQPETGEGNQITKPGDTNSAAENNNNHADNVLNSVTGQKSNGQATLPQTGEHSSAVLTIIGVALAGALGLGIFRRKED